MGEMHTRIGLDTGEFRRRLAGLENESRSGADRIDRAFGAVSRTVVGMAASFLSLRGMRRATDYLMSGVRELAKENRDAARAIDEHDRAWSRLKQNFGESWGVSLANRKRQVAGLIDEVTDFIGDAMVAQNIWSGTVEDRQRQRAHRDRLRSAREFREQWRQTAEVFRDTDRNLAQSEDDDLTLRRMDSRMQFERRRVELQRLMTSGVINESQHGRLLAREQTAYQQRDARILESLINNARQNRERLREQRETEAERRSDALMNVRFGEAERELQVARLRGAHEEVEVGQLRLELARRLRDIERDRYLTEDQRAAARQRLLEQSQEIEDLTRRNLRSGNDFRPPAMLMPGHSLPASAVVGHAGSRGESRMMMDNRKTADNTTRIASAVDELLSAVRGLRDTGFVARYQ